MMKMKSLFLLMGCLLSLTALSQSENEPPFFSGSIGTTLVADSYCLFFISFGTDRGEDGAYVLVGVEQDLRSTSIENYSQISLSSEGHTPTKDIREADVVGGGIYILGPFFKEDFEGPGLVVDSLFLDPDTYYSLGTVTYRLIDGEYLYSTGNIFPDDGFTTAPRPLYPHSVDTIITSEGLDIYPAYGNSPQVVGNSATATFFPENPEKMMEIIFEINQEDTVLNLEVFDGDNDQAPLLVERSSIVIGQRYRATNGKGALTFKSSRFNPNIGYSGPFGMWKATVYQAGTLEEGPANPPILGAYTLKEDAVELSWTRGAGDGILLVASQDPIEFLPENSKSYPSSSSFGEGEEVASGVYALYQGSDETITISDLPEQGFYYLRAFGYFEDGEEFYFNTEQFGELALPYLQKPTGDLNIQVDALDTAAILSWNDIGADGYLVTNHYSTELKDNLYYGNSGFPIDPSPGSRTPLYRYVEDDTMTTLYQLDFSETYDEFRLTPYNHLGESIVYGETVQVSDFQTLTRPPLNGASLVFNSVGYSELNVSLIHSRSNQNGSHVFLVAAEDTIPSVEIGLFQSEISGTNTFGRSTSKQFPKTSFLAGPIEGQASGMEETHPITLFGFEAGRKYVFGAYTANALGEGADAVYSIYQGPETLYTLEMPRDTVNVDLEDFNWCVGEQIPISFTTLGISLRDRTLGLDVRTSNDGYEVLDSIYFSGLQRNGRTTGEESILLVPELANGDHEFRWRFPGTDSTMSPWFTATINNIGIPTITASGSNLTTDITGDSAVWFLNDERVAEGATLANGNRAGDYVVVVYQEGCAVPSETLSVTGLDDAWSVAGLQVYPNPTMGTLQLNMPGELQTEGRVTVEVLTPQGRMVYRASNHPVESTINLNHLRSGLYLIHVKGAQYHTSTTFWKR
ncbi:MAG TPA: hypothetical protein DCE41_04065 [Cytophagales bacterium]|nr:hypothetical protein [Cytophagales bacterium]HAA23450.1 hypothetical protein [Cytophagales bacterium]HAP62811.1 hypothetical protein [Cytophagales bacterium]